VSIKLEAGSIATLASTELNALANNDAALGAEYDNATNLYLWGLFELLVDFVSAPTVDTPVELYLIPAPDGTNYADGDGTPTAPANCYVGCFVMRATTAAMRLVLGIDHRVDLPPTKFKALVYNKSGQAFPATGSTLKMVPYRLQ
jgi:hypothetical protein